MTNNENSREPYERGMLEVGDGNTIYWEVCGNSAGKPALVLHGGPGSGCSPFYRQFFDPNEYQIILFDQRGCGRSTPSAGNIRTDMSCNTTHHLIEDMELLREHLGIDEWLLFGASWGSTLSLAYAERHPSRVSEMVLFSVTTTTQCEIDWLYEGLSRLLPDQWHRFRQGVPNLEEQEHIVSGYARLMNDPDEEVRKRAASNWCQWEDAVLAHENDQDVNIYSRRSMEEKLTFVRIAAHYFSHGAWLDDRELLRRAEKLAGVPGELVHGRLDLASPLKTAWELDRAWPDARLHVIDRAGHTGTEAMNHQIRNSLAEFAR